MSIIVQCKNNHQKWVQFSGKVFLVITSKMCDSLKTYSPTHTCYIMKLFAWGYHLIYMFYLITSPLFPMWIHHKQITGHMFLLVLSAQSVHIHKAVPMRGRKIKTLEMNESPRAKERCSSLEFNIVMESEHTRSDLSVPPQGHNFQFRESPKGEFQN